MPRQARTDVPGAVHHVIVRGIELRQIFLDDQDRNNWIERLATVLDETGTPLLCLGVDVQSCPPVASNRPGAAFHRDAAVVDRLCCQLQPAPQATHGQLFQTRYKSILCQEDPYLRELVGDIHLNLLRVGRVQDIAGLDRYAFSGHSALMAHQDRPCQDTDYVLRKNRPLADGTGNLLRKR